MLENNMKYYKEFDVWQYMQNDYSALDKVNQRYSEYYGCVDKKGRPCYIGRKGKHEYEPEQYDQFEDNYFYEHDLLMCEFYLRGVLPYCSF